MDNGHVWLLMTRELSGKASGKELLELTALTEVDAELGYLREVFRAMWDQDPETDHEAFNAAWEKLKKKIE